MSSADESLIALKRIKDEFKAFCDERGSSSEADTRVKVIDRVLKEVCGWSESNIAREEHVHSGFIDYTLSLRGRPYVAVEAKREGIAFVFPQDSIHKSYKLSGAILTKSEIRDAVTQVRSYCDDIGIRYAIATNGYAWVIFRAIREDIPWREGSARVFPSLEYIIENFTDFWNLLSFGAINAGSLDGEFGSSLRPARELHRVIEALYNADLPLQRNRLHAQLHPLIKTVFEDIAEQDDLEILQSCYVHSASLKIVARDLDCVITDAIPDFLKKEGAEQVTPRKYDAGSFGAAVSTALRSDKGQLFLLLGGIGSGKSTFLKRYQKTVGKEVLHRNAFWFYVDFLEAPLDASDLEQFVWSTVLNQIRSRYQDSNLEVRANIKKAFEDKIRLLSETLLRHFHPSSREYEKGLSPHLDQWQKEIKDYVPRLLKVGCKLHEKRIVLFVDNVDQLTPAYQAQIFLLAQRVTRIVGSITIVALREESYYTASIQKTFTAYTNRKFHIASPYFKWLIGSRIHFAISVLKGEKQLPGFSFSSGIAIDRESISQFLEVVEKSLFGKNKSISRFVEAICFGNMRSALQMFTTFLVSGATDVEKILYIYHREGTYFVAFHEFLKSVMLGDRHYYKESQSPIMNLFDCGAQKNSSHFTALRILRLLLSHRGESTEEGQGYFEISKALSLFEDLFDDREDFIRSMNRLVNRQLVEVNTRSTDSILGASHVRATSAGWYYSRQLAQSFAYLDLVLQDTPLNQQKVEEELRRMVKEVDNLADKEENKLERMEIRFKRVEVFLNYLQEEEQAEIKDRGLGKYSSIISDLVMPGIIDAFGQQRVYIESRLKENREKFEEDLSFGMTEEEIKLLLGECYEAEVQEQEVLPLQESPPSDPQSK